MKADGGDSDDDFVDLLDDGIGDEAGSSVDIDSECFVEEVDGNGGDAWAPPQVAVAMLERECASVRHELAKSRKECARIESWLKKGARGSSEDFNGQR